MPTVCLLLNAKCPWNDAKEISFDAEANKISGKETGKGENILEIVMKNPDVFCGGEWNVRGCIH